MFPALFSVPIDLYQSAPRSTMNGTLKIVSTLLTVEGPPHRP